MPTKPQISACQMGMLMYSTIIITGILLLPSMLAKHAHRDMWLAPIWATFGGLFILLMCYVLHKLYPTQSIIEYSQHIVGRVTGKIIGLIVVLFYLHINSSVIREFGEFMVSAFFPKTPLIMIMISVVLVSALAVRCGVEVLGRCASVFSPIVLILFLLLVLLLIPELKPKYMFPVMENGPRPSLIAAIIPFGGWYGEFLLVAFLFPAIKDKEKGLRWGIATLLAVTFTMVLTNLVTLFLYGDMAEDISFPVMLAARYIEFADFFEHVEALVMAIWILGIFIKISMFFYVAALGTAQLLAIPDYRLLVFPFGLISLPLSMWLAPNLQELSHTIGTEGPFYYMTVQYLVPGLLVCTAFVRKKIQRRSRGAKDENLGDA